MTGDVKRDAGTGCRRQGRICDAKTSRAEQCTCWTQRPPRPVTTAAQPDNKTAENALNTTDRNGDGHFGVLDVLQAAQDLLRLPHGVAVVEGDGVRASGGRQVASSARCCTGGGCRCGANSTAAADTLGRGERCLRRAGLPGVVARCLACLALKRLKLALPHTTADDASSASRQARPAQPRLAQARTSSRTSGQGREGGGELLRPALPCRRGKDGPGRRRRRRRRGQNVAVAARVAVLRLAARRPAAGRG